MFKTETELQLELFPRNGTETETEIMPGTEISLERSTYCSIIVQNPNKFQMTHTCNFCDGLDVLHVAAAF